jgi:DnaJ homolog subfamily B member 4
MKSKKPTERKVLNPLILRLIIAMLHHPDRNKDDVENAKKKFQEVSEAFEVLSDKQKREIYDQLGEEGLKGGGMPGGGAGGFPGGFSGFSSGGPGGARTFRFSPSDPNDIFSQFFSQMGGGTSFSMGGMDDDLGGFGGFGGGRGGSRSRRTRMGGMGGMPGMGGFGGMESPPAEPETITRQLPVSLEEYPQSFAS